MANPLCAADPSHRGQQRYTKGKAWSDAKELPLGWFSWAEENQHPAAKPCRQMLSPTSLLQQTGVALWCKVQKCWRPLNGTMRLIRLVLSHTFIHPPRKTLWKLCHLIQVLRIHYYPLVHIFSTDIWGEKKDVKYLKNVYDMSLLKRKRWCVKEPLPHFG